MLISVYVPKVEVAILTFLKLKGKTKYTYICLLEYVETDVDN
jgi:hypothetical protein